MPFVLWKEGDTQNRTAARLYGDGITEGMVMYYRPNYKGTTRTAYIAILADGARREGDRGCSRMKRVIYAGNELAEFDSSGQRQWKFHPGEMTAAPTPILGATTVVGSFNLTFAAPHGLAVPTRVQLLPWGNPLPAPFAVNTYYWLQPTGATTVTILNESPLGEGEGEADTPVEADAVGTFAVYPTVNVGYRDPVQGNSWLFPEVNWCGSGLAWIEVLLPENLSDGEDEPSRAKYCMVGKLCQDFDATANGIAFNGVWKETTSPPLVLVDMYYWDGRMTLDGIYGRFNPNWKTEFVPRADGLLDWVGGGGDGLLATYHVGTNFDNPVLQRTETVVFNTWDGLTAPAPGVPATNFSIVYEGFIKVPEGGNYKFTMWVDNGVELKIDGVVVVSSLGDIAPREVTGSKFIPANTFVGFQLNYQNFNGPGELHVDYENDTSVLKQYIPQLVLYTAADAVRKAWRWNASVVFTSPTPLDTATESVWFRCPGGRWQDVDGKLKVLVDATQEEDGEALQYDPASGVRSNIISFGWKRKDAEDLYNFYSAMFRNQDDVFMARSGPLYETRVGLMAQTLWNLVAHPPFEMGVIQESLAARILATYAVLNSDFDVDFSVTAQITTYALAKGDFVPVVDVSAGYNAGQPALGMVTTEGFALSALPTRSFKLTGASKLYYQDESHGPVAAVIRSLPTGLFHVPEPISVYDVHDVGRYDGSGAWFAAIEGTASVTAASNAVSVKVEYSLHAADDYRDFGSLEPVAGEVAFLIPVESGKTYDVRLTAFNRRTGSSMPLSYHPVVEVVVDIQAPPPDPANGLAVMGVLLNWYTTWDPGVHVPNILAQGEEIKKYRWRVRKDGFGGAIMRGGDDAPIYIETGTKYIARWEFWNIGFPCSSPAVPNERGGIYHPGEVNPALYNGCIWRSQLIRGDSRIEFQMSGKLPPREIFLVDEDGTETGVFWDTTYVGSDPRLVPQFDSTKARRPMPLEVYYIEVLQRHARYGWQGGIILQSDELPITSSYRIVVAFGGLSGEPQELLSCTITPTEAEVFDYTEGMQRLDNAGDLVSPAYFEVRQESNNPNADASGWLQFVGVP